jgi:CoA:oxalate CoA-transferase
VIGTLAAIHQAQRSGIGQHVDVSILGVMTMMLSGEPFDLLEHRSGVSNERWLHLDLRTHGRLRPRSVSRDRPTGTGNGPALRRRDARVLDVTEVDELIKSFTCFRTNAEVIANFEEHGVPAAEVRHPEDADVRSKQAVFRFSL